MVGERGGQGGAAARLTASVRSAYDAATAAWAGGPARVYARLAEALLASSAVPVAGHRVLDIGAGTGVAGSAALAAGARLVVAADIAAGMLRRVRPPQHPVAADATALPFRDGSFDVVLAAFCLNHLPSVPGALTEARRVGSAITASMFAPGWTHPAKTAVDDALRPFGYRPPAWYLEFKRLIEPRASDPDLLARQAAAAGFTGVVLRATTVATGLSTPPELASWRLGMAHVAPFLRSLEAPRRAAACRAAERAVAGTGPLVVSMMVREAS